MVGTTLSHYRVLRRLGAGGMGEVYLAFDTRLEREVALKVLPETLTDSARLARLKREALAVAALKHPNIVTLYAIEEADGLPFLVMELVEGETLRQRIPPTGFPLEELLRLAVPLADAVASAHARGVTHRDLNVPARALYYRAVELEPGFARAWAQIAILHAWSDAWFGRREEERQAAERAAHRALELAPDLAEAHVGAGVAHAHAGRGEEATGWSTTATSILCGKICGSRRSWSVSRTDRARNRGLLDSLSREKGFDSC